MKALTLRHPWAFAICNLAKCVENRGWAPRHNELSSGQRFAIHAGKLSPIGEIQDAFAWMIECGLVRQSDVPALEMLKRQQSAVVAVATFGGTTTFHPSRWFVGPVGWELYDVVVLPAPVPCRGAQGLWTLPQDVERLVLGEIGALAQ
jgi:hypothetical protein